METIRWSCNPPAGGWKHGLVVFFDIDGTLLRAGGVHREAFFFALEKLFGIQIPRQWADYAGRTDPWIVKDMVSKHGGGRNISDEEVSLVLETMNEYYVSRINQEGERGTVFPGVVSFLEWLDSLGIMRGLVTGNTETIAFHKLRAFNLERGFATGGFGSDHEDRSVLLSIALERARQIAKFPEPPAAVYIADTPRDVEAATCAGMVPVAVLNGILTRADFSKVSPRFVLPSLEESGPLKRFIVDLLEEHE